MSDFGRWLYHYFLGDDWSLALGAVSGLGLGIVAAHHGFELGWCIPPSIIILMLAISVRRATEKKL